MEAELRPPAEALPLLEEALRLWRGVPYGEFADELWAVAEVNRLGELRMNAIESRAQALLDVGRPQPVIHELEAETVEHPLRERLWWLRALALHRSGRQADALATIRRARKVIADQLGLDPGPELRELECPGPASGRTRDSRTGPGSGAGVIDCACWRMSFRPAPARGRSVVPAPRAGHDRPRRRESPGNGGRVPGT
ncbi:BTAD domain-containing putative transcriptional regulator [Nonomuraea sp. NPDC049607]|uniref:AfsR/SARP family transcriptional regulator n=1 Tax=Nonomuraea sp. NPDC049607 TaxID=3154732 RepID=UPI003432971C